MIDDNLKKMHPSQASGMDIIIISTNNSQQEQYWQKRLMDTRGAIAKEDATIIVIHEDWPGGAGNGLGTLYAYQKARQKGLKECGVDIFQQQGNGASIAIYHTAGKGTRLAPLPASEGNNKSAVKLPGVFSCGGNNYLLTILEAVIRQTAIYAPSRGERLSVFWGDQLFIPSTPCDYTPSHHVDILAKFSAIPGEKRWGHEGWHKYGLLAVDCHKNARQVEKVDFTTFETLIQEKKLAIEGGFGLSLGSFSLSAEMTMALLDEFEDELEAKNEKLDTDPHFWMPLTLDHDTYQNIMINKGTDKAWIEQHYQRMLKFRDRFVPRYPNLKLVGAHDIGKNSFWWDYGNNQDYFQNSLKLLGNDETAQAMNQFFCVNETPSQSPYPHLDLDEHSQLFDCNIQSGKIENSLLIGVTAKKLNVSNSVIINTVSPQIETNQCLLYNAVDRDKICLDTESIRADSFFPNEKKHVPMVTSLQRDGKEDWSEKVCGNPHSYEEIHNLNVDCNLEEVATFANEVKKNISEKVNNNEPCCV